MLAGMGGAVPVFIVSLMLGLTAQDALDRQQNRRGDHPLGPCAYDCREPLSSSWTGRGYPGGLREGLTSRPTKPLSWLALLDLEALPCARSF